MNVVGGTIHRDEAYSKANVLSRLGISQKYWDKMLDAGLRYASIGKARWVTGAELLRYFENIAETKSLAC